MTTKIPDCRQLGCLMIVVIPQRPLCGNDNAEGLLHFVAVEGGIDMATQRVNVTTVMKLMVRLLVKHIIGERKRYITELYFGAFS